FEMEREKKSSRAGEESRRAVAQSPQRIQRRRMGNGLGRLGAAPRKSKAWHRNVASHRITAQQRLACHHGWVALSRKNPAALACGLSRIMSVSIGPVSMTCVGPTVVQFVKSADTSAVSETSAAAFK